MGRVSMRMCMGGLDIGPAFRVERRFDVCAFAAQRSDQRFQCMVAPQANAVRKELDRDVAAEKLHNPIPSSDASIARGDSLFHKLCVPCHGRSMAGDGPVAAQFMTPPDLLAQQTRERKDGFIYTYIRHGGVVMPSYGFQVSAEEAWHLVNFIRHQQKMSPR